MKNLLAPSLAIALYFSCNIGAKKVNIESTAEVKVKRNINSLLAYQSLLFKNQDDFEPRGVLFNEQGVTFGVQDNPCYLNINEVDFDLSKPFNISFTYKTFSGDGSKPQALISFQDQFSSPSSIPFFIYTAANRITAVYDKQALWAEDYKPKGEMSRKFYDSFVLDKDIFYFISINFDGKNIDIYVESELYASFDLVSPSERPFSDLVLGAIVSKNDNYLLPFKGTIHGLKLFNTYLMEREIIMLYNNQPVL
ncbi:MAG: hypothetical protein CMP80_06935 [Formosa sp.]|nr:hypothetical protein [Formosa sp.]|tara:strand:+ start:7859 stop:8614 length:756 start_codon:yes stop_codon:yes gene_type:complete